jgi:Cupin superfamily protein
MAIRMEDILSPVSTADFLRDYYGRSILHLDGDSNRWEPVFGWPDLNAILSFHRLGSPQLLLVRAGAAIDEHLYTESFGSRRGGSFRRLDAGRVAAALRSGATLVLHAVDDLAPSLSDLAYQVEHLFRAPVTVNLYASWSAVEGFNVHWDDHDVFVMQVAGSKRWQIFAPTQPWPSERYATRPRPPESPPVAEVRLDAGHLLYIPHGWWHVANAEEGPSLHLTIGVKPPSGIDLLDYVLGLVSEHEPVRRRLPRFDSDGSAEEYVTTLAALVEKALNV